MTFGPQAGGVDPRTQIANAPVLKLWRGRRVGRGLVCASVQLIAGKAVAQIQWCRRVRGYVDRGLLVGPNLGLLIQPFEVSMRRTAFLSLPIS